MARPFWNDAPLTLHKYSYTGCVYMGSHWYLTLILLISDFNISKDFRRAVGDPLTI